MLVINVSSPYARNQYQARMLVIKVKPACSMAITGKLPSQRIPGKRQMDSFVIRLVVWLVSVFVAAGSTVSDDDRDRLLSLNDVATMIRSSSAASEGYRALVRSDYSTAMVEAWHNGMYAFLTSLDDNPSMDLSIYASILLYATVTMFEEQLKQLEQTVSNSQRAAHVGTGNTLAGETYAVQSSNFYYQGLYRRVGKILVIKLMQASEKYPELLRYLSAIVGVEPSQLADYLHGKHDIPFENVAKFKKAINDHAFWISVIRTNLILLGSAVLLCLNPCFDYWIKSALMMMLVALLAFIEYELSGVLYERLNAIPGSTV